MRRRLAAALLALNLGGLGLGLAACSADDGGCETNAQGVIECAPDRRTAAPTVSGTLLDGTPYDLGSERGDVVVLNFWGSWCAPCRAEADDLENVYTATKDRGVAFLGINGRDDLDKAKAFVAGRHTYPSLFDSSGRLSLDFDLPPNGTPSTIILDRAGRVAVVIRGAVVQSTLQPYVERVAAEAA
jgi:thiol-disulfide isomerase/thioredoxin